MLINLLNVHVFWLNFTWIQQYTQIGLLLVWLFMPSVFAQTTPKERVIIFHGITRDSEFLQPMADFLTQQGFEVFNLDYPSTKYTIQELVTQQVEQLPKLLNTGSGTVHFIGHSMGGLLITGVLDKWRPAKLGRVVHLGTPHHGSELTELLKNTSFYKKDFGVAGQQLVANAPEFGWRKPDYELGIVAGKVSWFENLLYWPIFRQSNDGRVSVESSKLEGMKRHIVLPVHHNEMPSSTKVQAQVLAFLVVGGFFPIKP